jgi:hypothetical protein
VPWLTATSDNGKADRVVGFVFQQNTTKVGNKFEIFRIIFGGKNEFY